MGIFQKVELADKEAFIFKMCLLLLFQYKELQEQL